MWMPFALNVHVQCILYCKIHISTGIISTMCKSVPCISQNNSKVSTLHQSIIEVQSQLLMFLEISVLCPTLAILPH